MVSTLRRIDWSVFCGGGFGLAWGGSGTIGAAVGVGFGSGLGSGLFCCFGAGSGSGGCGTAATCWGSGFGGSGGVGASAFCGSGFAGCGSGGAGGSGSGFWGCACWGFTSDFGGLVFSAIVTTSTGIGVSITAGSFMRCGKPKAASRITATCRAAE